MTQHLMILYKLKLFTYKIEKKVDKKINYFALKIIL